MENQLFSLSPAFSPAQTLAPLSFSFGPISFSFLFSLRSPKPRRRPMSPFPARPVLLLLSPTAARAPPVRRVLHLEPDSGSSPSAAPARASPRLAWPARRGLVPALYKRRQTLLNPSSKPTLPLARNPSAPPPLEPESSVPPPIHRSAA